MRCWLFLSCCFSIIFASANSFSPIKPITAVTGRPNLSIGFLLQRTVSINQKACSCPNPSSCSCCQSVTILLRGVARNLCVNFTYSETGLSMTILLGSKTIRHVSVIDYRAFKVCTAIPDCQFSFACVDVMEVSLFPKSVTICMQLDITSKNVNWLINYNCISVSTILSNQTNSTATTMGPSMGMNGTQPTGMPGNGQMPPGQMQPGQMQPGQMQPGQMQPGQMQPGQMQPGQMQPGQMQPGQMQPGQMQPGQMQPGQMQPGQMQPGQMQPGQMQPGQMQPGQMQPGQMQPGQMQPGQMVFGQMQRKLSGGVREPNRGSAIRVLKLPNSVLSRKSREMRPTVKKVQNSLVTQGLSLDGNSRLMNILSVNEISRNTQQEVPQVFKNQKVPIHQLSIAIKIRFRNNFNHRKTLVSKNYLRTKPLNHRERRNIEKPRNNSPMKMQVILRSRKTRIPKIKNGIDSMRSLKASPKYPASRNSKIVNENTISNPMSQLGLENVLTSDVASSDGALRPNTYPLDRIPIDNGSQSVFVPPQPLPVSPSDVIPVPPPVLVLEIAPSIAKPILSDFEINYDNRTSSFPDRMPPSFGMASRIGPNFTNRSLQPFERDVEELETVGPEIALPPNSKLVEISSSTDLSDGRMIFPE